MIIVIAQDNKYLKIITQRFMLFVHFALDFLHFGAIFNEALSRRMQMFFIWTRTKKIFPSSFLSFTESFKNQ